MKAYDEGPATCRLGASGKKPTNEKERCMYLQTARVAWGWCGTVIPFERTTHLVAGVLDLPAQRGRTESL